MISLPGSPIMIPLADQYVRDLELRNRELEETVEKLRADHEICIRRIKVLEEAVKGPVF